MSRSAVVLSIVLVSGTVAPAASAQSAEGEASQGQMRRDPNGQTGISPYAEQLAKGRQAFTSNDLDGAIAAFQQAINLAPDKQAGYLLMTQAQLAKGNVEAALRVSTDGVKKKGTERAESKMLFVGADVVERSNDSAAGSDNAPGTAFDKLAQKWAKVTEAWASYAMFVGAHPKVPGYQASAEDRQKKVADRIKRDKDYGEVRERVAKNEKERAKKKKK